MSFLWVWGEPWAVASPEVGQVHGSSKRMHAFFHQVTRDGFRP